MNKNVRCNSPASPRRWVARAAAKAATATALCGALLWSAGRLAAQTDGVWNVTTNGNAAGTNFWSTATNWQGSTVANGTDAIADFSQLTLSGDETIHLDAPRTIGALAFGDQGYIYNWTLDNNQQASNTLTLAANYFPQPAISVTNGVATISAAIAGDEGVALNPQYQQGTLVLSGANTYSGTTNINFGTLMAGATNAFSPNSGVSMTDFSTIVLNGFSQSIQALNGSGTITNNASSPVTLTVQGGGTFSGDITDNTSGGTTGKLSLNATGLTLTGANGGNGYTGTTMVGGLVTLDFPASGVQTNIINPVSPLVLSGILAVNDAHGPYPTQQTFNGSTLAGVGISTVSVSAYGDTSPASALVLGALTRGPGAAVNLSLPSAGSITTTTPNTNGIIGPWATVNGTDWAANSGVADAAGGCNIVAYSSYSYDYTDATAATPSPNFGWGVGNNTAMISTTAATTNTVAAGSTTNSLLFSTSSNYSINLTGANTFTGGGILVSQSANSPSITIGGSGSLTVGPDANELIVSNFAGGTVTINAAILDNGSGSTELTMYSGEVILTNPANSYGGATTAARGILQISTDHDLGVPPSSVTPGDLVLIGSTLQTSGTFTLNSNRGIAITGRGELAVTISVHSGTLTYGGVVADGGFGPSTLTVAAFGADQGALLLTGANTYSGGTEILNGLLSIASDAALGATTGTVLSFPFPESANVQLDSGTLQLATGFSGGLSSERSFYFGAGLGDNGTIDTNGNGSETAPITFAGGFILNHFVKAGAGVFELDSTPIIAGDPAGGPGVAVAGGSLRLNYAATPNIIGNDVPGGGLGVSISPGAALELAGAASQLNQFTYVDNGGSLVVSSGAPQIIGFILPQQLRPSPAGFGDTVVNAGSNLTAYQIVQNSLTIHGMGTTVATAGSVTLVPSGSGSTTNPTGPNNINFSSTLASLSIDGNNAPLGSRVYYGTLDIGNNGLVIAYGSGPDPYAQIDDMIRSGCNGGTWTGTGITSSLAAAAVAIGSSTPALNIGLLDFTPGVGNYSNTTFIVFEGQTVTNNAILLRLTYMDDLVLAGDMSPQDAASDALLFAANVDSGTTWNTGDLTHSGLVNASDALLFAANFAVGLPSLDGTTGGDAAFTGSVAAGAAAVPEPAGLALNLLGAAGLGIWVVGRRGPGYTRGLFGSIRRIGGTIGLSRAKLAPAARAQ